MGTNQGNRAKRCRDALVITSFTKITAEQVAWLWPNVIPLGKLSLIAGFPGMNKSLVTVDIASRISRGTALPFSPGTASDPGDVLFLSAEDSAEDTIKPRLLAAGADMDRVHSASANIGSNRMFRLTDLRMLDQAVMRFRALKLIVIDPLSAYMGGVDSYRDASVRELLSPLTELAARRRVAIIGVVHLNKGARGDALARITGSVGIGAAARAVWLVGKDPEQDSGRVMACIKSNLGPDGMQLRFNMKTVSVPGLPNQPKAQWIQAGETCSLTAIMQASGERDKRCSEIDRAVAWLRDTLAEQSLPAEKVKALAKSNDLSEPTLNRAKSLAGIVSRKAGEAWYWKLTKPVQGDQDCQK
jgi:putative DNA primase/helicase